jgi:hypothetical protein
MRGGPIFLRASLHSLNGLPHEMDLAHGLNRGRGQFLNLDAPMIL